MAVMQIADASLSDIAKREADNRPEALPVTAAVSLAQVAGRATPLLGGAALPVYAIFRLRPQLLIPPSANGGGWAQRLINTDIRTSSARFLASIFCMTRAR